MLSGPANKNNGRRENKDESKERERRIDCIQYTLISFGILCSLAVVTLLVWVVSVYIYGQGINSNSIVTLEHGIPMNQIVMNNQNEDMGPADEDTIKALPEESEEERRNHEKREQFWRL